MCNLYSMRSGQAAIIALTRAMHDRTGNMPPLPGIFPDYPAPIVRNTDEGRELALARWGMPSSKKAILENATKRADKLRAKGGEVDFAEILRMEPDKGGGYSVEAVRESLRRDGWVVDSDDRVLCSDCAFSGQSDDE